MKPLSRRASRHRLVAVGVGRLESSEPLEGRSPLTPVWSRHETNSSINLRDSRLSRAGHFFPAFHLTLTDAAQRTVVGMVIAASPELGLYSDGKMVWHAP